MNSEFKSLTCPNCNSDLIYSDGTHDLKCKNNNAENLDPKFLDTRCTFAVSFTTSENYGTLWSVRLDRSKTNYEIYLDLMVDIEKRLSENIPLAENTPDAPRGQASWTKEEQICRRYNLEVEDLYSICYSSESIDELAVYYGLDVRDIKSIKDIEGGLSL